MLNIATQPCENENEKEILRLFIKSCGMLKENDFLRSWHLKLALKNEL